MWFQASHHRAMSRRGEASGGREFHQPSRLLRLLVGVLAVAVVAAGASFAGLRLAPKLLHHAKGTSAATRAATAATTRLRVVSTSPASGATVAPDATVSVTFSRPVALAGPLPSLNPAVPGSWALTAPKTLTFRATAPMPLASPVTLTVPGGAGGVRSSGGGRLAATVTVGFRIHLGTVLRLQQLLAEAGYLPLTFNPSGPPPAPAQVDDTQPGTFAWRWPSLPVQLTSQWLPGSFGEITKAAVMAFQNDNHLPVDGIPQLPVWQALVRAVAAGTHPPGPYTYVLVSKVIPETLNMWVNGAPQYQNILVNTGVHGANTPDGTYAVFEHVPFSRMKGTNPNGTTYNDPHVPWASFFHGGDALHGFVRASYGTPQSNGCVEMPVATAQQLWPLTPIGTLVTIMGPSS